MAFQKTDVLEVLKTNYLKATALMPEELAKEFQRNVIRPGDLKKYASAISVATQFRDETSMLKIQNWMVDHFNKGGFGKKLAAKGIDPNRVYEQLLKGIYDYR
jgi:hypothetical protein